MRWLLVAWFHDAAAFEVDAGELVVSNQPADAVEAAQAALRTGRFADAALAWHALAEAGGGWPARLGEAVALYEGGSAGAARAAVERVVAEQPASVPALNLLGIAQVDTGRVEAGIATLERALRNADGPWRARVRINLALARADRGEAAAARALLDAAAPDASGIQLLQDSLLAARNTLAALDGNDVGVGPLLARGDLGAARTAAVQRDNAATTRRARAEAGILLSAVDRAEGRLDEAARRLQATATLARDGSLLREAAIAMGNLGLVQGLSGRTPLALDSLRASIELARAGGYRVVEVDSLCELGMTLARGDDLDGAEQAQRTAGALLAAMDYPQGVVRQAELGGVIAALRGDAARADTTLGRAVDAYGQRGRFLDAARAATWAAAAWQTRDDATADRWSRRAEDMFQRAGDPLGPAHVRMARGLAAARAGRDDVALAAFAQASAAAQGRAGERGATVARVAKENAARVLVRMGDGPDAAKRAAEGGLTEIVGRERALRDGFGAYDAGLAAYGAQDWARAQARFATARAAFERLGETGYVTRTRRASGWAAYNALVSTPAAQAAPKWSALVEETAQLEEPELYLRTYAASALADHQAQRGDPGARLAECTRRAEALGFREIAARCHGALAERPGDLAERARHARTAFGLAPEEAGAVYALYAVAVDALNEDQPALAVELATLARPRAGQLQKALDEVLRAARR
jgi:hypothetical protein